MRKFIDIPRKPRTLAEMRQYLKNHYRRYGWIGYSDSELGIGCRVKVRDLITYPKEREAMYTALSGNDEGLYIHSGVNYELAKFSELHPGHVIYQVGRSNGYFVLHYNGKYSHGPIWAVDDEIEDNSDLRSLFQLVWDFDQTCNKAVASFVEYCVYESPNWELAAND